jgi:hypothetical protein
MLLVTDAAVERLVARITEAAPVVLRVRGLGGPRWVRKVRKRARIGPWLQADYDVVDRGKWRREGACFYLVCASDARVRYVGFSENRLRDRWRTSPAYDAETKVRLAQDQLFHSQCWKHMEAEMAAGEGAWYEVRHPGARAGEGACGAGAAMVRPCDGRRRGYGQLRRAGHSPAQKRGSRAVECRMTNRRDRRARSLT